MLGHLGSKLGLQRVSLGTSWAILGPFGALLEGPGRHLEAEIGLGSADLELTCGKKATRPNASKTLGKQLFSMISEGREL